MTDICTAMMEARLAFLRTKQGMAPEHRDASLRREGAILGDMAADLHLSNDEMRLLVPEIAVSVDTGNGCVRDMHIRCAAGGDYDFLDILVSLTACRGTLEACKSLTVETETIAALDTDDYVLKHLFVHGLIHFGMKAGDRSSSPQTPNALGTIVRGLVAAKTSLVCLELEGVGLGGDDDETVDALCAFLQGNSWLRHLHLQHNRLTIPQFVRIAQALDTPANALMTLRVCDNLCAENVADELRKTTWLKNVMVPVTAPLVYIVQRDFLDARSEALTLAENPAIALNAWLANALVAAAAAAGASGASSMRFAPLEGYVPVGREVAVVSAPGLQAAAQEYMTRKYGDNAVVIQRPERWVDRKLLIIAENLMPQMNALCRASCYVEAGGPRNDVDRYTHLPVISRMLPFWIARAAPDDTVASVVEANVVCVSETLQHKCSFILQITRYIESQPHTDDDPNDGIDEYDGEAVLAFVHPPLYIGLSHTVATCNDIATAVNTMRLRSNLRLRILKVRATGQQ